MQTLLQRITLKVHILSNKLHGSFLGLLKTFEVPLLVSLLHWCFSLSCFLCFDIPWQFDAPTWFIFKQKVVDDFVARALRCYYDRVDISHGLVYIYIFIF